MGANNSLSNAEPEPKTIRCLKQGDKSDVLTTQHHCAPVALNTQILAFSKAEKEKKRNKWTHFLQRNAL